MATFCFPRPVNNMVYINMVTWNVAFCIVAVSTITGNLLFLVVFFKSDRLRRMRTSLLLISLTTADLIVGAVAIPMYMAIVWPGSEVARKRALNQSYYMIDVVSGFASLFGLAVIALESVYSVFRPHKHRLLTKTPYFVAVLVSWLLATLQMILNWLKWNNVITPNEYFYFVFTWISAVVIGIFLLYFAVWMRLKANRLKGLHRRRVEQENKLTKTLTILTGIFLITWLPFHVIVAVFNLCKPCRNKVPLHLVYAAKLLHYSNSLANPVVYSFRFPEVRRTLARIFCRQDHMVAPTELRIADRRRKDGESKFRSGAETQSRINLNAQ